MPLHLAGAVPDPLDPGVAPEPLDRQVAHQAHAAVDLDGSVGDASEHLRRVELGHRGVGVGHPALGQLPRGLQREQLGRLDLGRHVGQREADALEPADRLPELLAARRPLRAQLQHPPGPAHAESRDRQPAGAEPLAEQVEAMALVAEQRCTRHPRSRRTTAHSGGSRGGTPTRPRAAPSGPACRGRRGTPRSRLRSPRDVCSVPVTANSTTKSDTSAWLMKCLVPLMTQPSPSRRAIVVIARTSEPAPGSDIARQSCRSPRIVGSRYRSTCSP